MPTTTPDRASIIKGPAKMVWDSATIIFGADFSVDLISVWQFVINSATGAREKRLVDRYVEIKGAPLMWSDLGKIYPYATAQFGDTLFGLTDKPAVITPRNGEPITVANVMPTALAGITCHPSKSMLRDMTFTGLCANASNPALESSYWSRGASATNVALTGVDLSKVINGFYSASFNAVTYKPQDGFDLDFNMAIEADKYDGLTVNFRFTEEVVQAAVKFIPIATETQYATLMGWGGKQPGDSAAHYPLTISGDATGKPRIALANMMVAAGGVRYGRAARAGEITMESIRQETAGLLTALWTFDTVP